MTTVFEGAPKFGGISGDYARVTAIEDRVLIRAIDSMAEEAVTIAMTPKQARALAAGIVAAADNVAARGWSIIASDWPMTPPPPKPSR